MNFQRMNHFDSIKDVAVLGIVTRAAKMLRLPKIMKKVLLLATKSSKSKKCLQLTLCLQVLTVMCKNGCKKICLILTRTKKIRKILSKY